MKKTLRGGFAATAIFLAAGILSCAKFDAQGQAGPADLVMSSCTACHQTDPICAALGKKSGDEWNATVSRMVEKGAHLDKSRIPEVARYLASLKPGASPVCKESR